MFHREFAPTLGAVRDALPELTGYVMVDDDSGAQALPDAAVNEDALAPASPRRASGPRPPAALSTP